jgi:hypothetical protein
VNKLKEEVIKVDFKAFVKESQDMNTKITGEEIPYEVAFVFSSCVLAKLAEHGWNPEDVTVSVLDVMNEMLSKMLEKQNAK